MAPDRAEGFKTNPSIIHRYRTRSQKGDNLTRTNTTQWTETGNNGNRNMSGPKTAQAKLPILLKNRRSGGRPETVLPKKGKGDDRIAFEPGTEPGTDPEVVFTRIVTPPRKKKENAHATYVLMSVKLPALKKAIDTLQQKLSEIVDMLLQMDDTINILPVNDDTELRTIMAGTQVTKSMIKLNNI